MLVVRLKSVEKKLVWLANDPRAKDGDAGCSPAAAAVAVVDKRTRLPRGATTAGVGDAASSRAHTYTRALAARKQQRETKAQTILFCLISIVFLKFRLYLKQMRPRLLLEDKELRRGVWMCLKYAECAYNDEIPRGYHESTPLD